MSELRRALVSAVGEDHVKDAAADLSFYSMDIYGGGPLPMIGVCPDNALDLGRAVALATSAGHAVVPRGGGISYSGGIVPERAGSVVVDTACMKRILEIAPADMYVTVEAGCTWEALRAALRHHGMRTPFWGPLSGQFATVGGTVSQQAVMWGSAKHGPSSESVLGLQVVLADGSVVTTGQGAFATAKPFWRHYGPDLTGLFLADAGALGVKTAVTLKLLPEPPAIDYLSFSFSDRRSLVAAMSEVARNGLSSAGFALDPLMQEQRIRRAALSQGVEAVREMVITSKRKLQALLHAVRIAAKGRGFLDPDGYSLHLVLDGRSEAAVAADADAIRRICATGKELDDTIPRLLYAKPYASMTSALGPEGQRWAPLNCIVALSDVDEAWDRLEAFLADREPDLTRLGVETGFMVSTIGSGAFLLEMVMTWPGSRPPYYDRLVEASKLSRYPSYDTLEETDTYVAALRDDLMDVFAEMGAAHLQIGKRYPYRRTLDPQTANLLAALKLAVDPHGLMNPGALGLP